MQRLSFRAATAITAMLAGTVTLASSSGAGTTGERIAAAAAVGENVTAVGADSFANISISFPDGVRGLPDITYQTLNGYRPMKLDLYLPPARFDSAAPRPWVMYIHGGGWMGGGPRRSAAYLDWPRVLASLAARGYVVASASYRFSREAPFPAQIQDVKAAIRWLKANAATYHLDVNRGMTWGQSAGGHLAALVAVSCGVAAFSPPAGVVPRTATVELQASTAAGADQQSDCVQGAVAWFGVYDFSKMPQADATVKTLLGCGDAVCPPEKLLAASPIHYVDTKDPPMLIMHGAEDALVPLAQSQQFHAALLAAGVPSRLIVVPAVGHSWIGKTAVATQSASRNSLAQAIDFIDATIGDRPKQH